MALDSKEKRQNATGVGRPWLRDHFPQATPDQEWRISIGNAWGGNALTGAAVGTGSVFDSPVVSATGGGAIFKSPIIKGTV